MAICNSNVKACVTCSGWGGQRSAVNMGHQVEANFQLRGNCSTPGRYGNKPQGQSLCQDWRKWGALR